mgnify:CR=1 FL=1
MAERATLTSEMERQATVAHAELDSLRHAKDAQLVEAQEKVQQLTQVCRSLDIKRTHSFLTWLWGQW